MYLVDSSSWIEYLRANGRPDVKDRVESLMDDDEAAWCYPVRLELWNGANGAEDARNLARMEKLIHNLEINDAVGVLSTELARKARARGRSVPAMDILIAACAAHHEIPVESCDEHFKWLARLL